MLSLYKAIGVLAVFVTYSWFLYEQGASAEHIKGEKKLAEYKNAVTTNSNLILLQQSKLKKSQADEIAKLDDKYMGELLDERENTDAIIDGIRSGKLRKQSDKDASNSTKTTINTETTCGIDAGERERRLEEDKQLAIETVKTLGLCKTRIKQLTGLQSYSLTITKEPQK